MVWNVAPTSGLRLLPCLLHFDFRQISLKLLFLKHQSKCAIRSALSLTMVGKPQAPVGVKPADDVNRLERQAAESESILKEVKEQVVALGRILAEKEIQRLKEENEALKQQVKAMKGKVGSELGIGPLPAAVLKTSTDENTKTPPAKQQVDTPQSTKTPTAPKATTGERSGGDEKKKKKEKKQEIDKSEKPQEAKVSAEDDVHVGLLDLRIGKIVRVEKHPDADSLYVESIDVGEEKPRTVVSGLVRFVPIEEMANRMVVVLCNLKPAKMRGITSEAMVMCASTPEKVEILTPPDGSKPGQKVIFKGYNCCPPSVLNPKKKIFEQVAPDLKTDSSCIATYKGVPFEVEGLGLVKAPSLTGVNIK